MRVPRAAILLPLVLSACGGSSESKVISKSDTPPVSNTAGSYASSETPDNDTLNTDTTGEDTGTSDTGTFDTGTHAPVASDTGAAESGEEGVSLPSYCDGAPEHVACSPDVNLDDWWVNSPDMRFDTITGTVLSLPFTIRASYVDGGNIASTTVEGMFHDDTNFRIWFSADPGGAPLSDTSRCNNYFKQARFTVPWTQNPEMEDDERYCFLGEGPRVLYVNVEVCAHHLPDWECSDERRGDYIFDLRINYRQW